MSIWLEVSPCLDIGPSVQLDDKIVQKVSVLSTLMSAAQHAKSGKQTLWDYSLKVSEDEAQQVRDVITFGVQSEDTRSVILSAGVGYHDSCYALRLFFEKSQ